MTLEIYASIGFLAIGSLWLKYGMDRETFWFYVELFGRANRAATRERKRVWEAGLAEVRL